jgi:hypothetical protein
MSRQSQLGALKKDELIKKLLEVEEKLADKPAEAESDFDPNKESATAESMTELLRQNKELRERVDKMKETDKFVFVRCQSKGRVWLPAPESRNNPLESGRGRMLVGDKDFAIIPAYWMVDLLAHEHDAFVNGEVVIDNEYGRSMNPAITFVDFDLPKTYIDASIKNEEIEKIVKRADNTIYEFLKKYSDKRYVLGRVKGIVDAFVEKEESKKEEARNTAFISFLQAVSIHIDETLSPDREEETRKRKEREEIIFKTV